MPPPVPNPLNLPISHTFLQTMYVQMQQNTKGLGQILTRVILCGQHIRLNYDNKKMNNYLPIKTNNQHKITPTSKYLSHFGCRFGLYQKMAHAFGRDFKLTLNGTVSF